ncbi:helix-turn-helix domain-containing protein [Actinokineospora sp. NBRC 105648]|uniref:winged helix-turn-helix transcriptional regulator n=1 Tax=Actinokineospora sp. NBRC 105648 TaxID=3032206 RepID=UPI0024A1C28F|nr:helix-turn-helix domain-containing protein [Actinokineospora sp. NBRC 105648]GLZ40284.1 HxlR family transcriptional regulator [Actinokineospora sp. NBRC 105648]
MNVRRTRYYCPVEFAVEVIGGKWAVVVLAHLKDGEHRYGELRRRMPEVSEKVLTTRLRELEDADLVERTSDGGTPPAVTYRLTPEAAELTPALRVLYDWGRRRAEHQGIPIEPVC